MRKNWLTTIGGIMALMGGIPIALGSAHVAMPPWFYLLCISCGVIGPGIIGIAAKGQDEQTKPNQVEIAQIVIPAPPTETNQEAPKP
jgi:hypothetical protein